MAEKVLRLLAATLIGSIIFPFDSVDANKGWDCDGAKTDAPSGCWFNDWKKRDERCKQADCKRKYQWTYEHWSRGACYCCECWDE